MNDEQLIEKLKKILLDEVDLLCSPENCSDWQKPIHATINEINERKWNAVFFGGALRSLLLSKLTNAKVNNKLVKPRDIDIVIENVTVDDLHDRFNKYVRRDTYFDGLQLERDGLKFDIWPLDETYVLGTSHFQYDIPEFVDLPSTTFLNLEAVAIETSPKPGHQRQIYSGDDQFFKGIINKTIELNWEDHPSPELCVTRALILSATLQWKIGPHLLDYIAGYGAKMRPSKFTSLQTNYHGVVNWSESFFEKSIKEICSIAHERETQGIELPWDSLKG